MESIHSPKPRITCKPVQDHPLQKMELLSTGLDLQLIKKKAAESGEKERERETERKKAKQLITWRAINEGFKRHLITQEYKTVEISGPWKGLIS